MVQTRQVTPTKRQSPLSSNSAESRPKRSVSVKNYNEEEEHGIQWREENDLNKALYASLQYSDLQATHEEKYAGISRTTSCSGSYRDSVSVASSSSNGNKVHAQRKFAQNAVYPFTPETTPHKTKPSVSVPRNVPTRPKTEDFLTFLCLRGTPDLPRHLNFFNYPGASQLSMLRHRRDRTPDSTSSSDTEIWEDHRRAIKIEKVARKKRSDVSKRDKLSAGKLVKKSKPRYNAAATSALKRGKMVASKQTKTASKKATKRVGKSTTRLKLPTASRTSRLTTKPQKRTKQKARNLRSQIQSSSQGKEKSGGDPKLLRESSVMLKNVKIARAGGRDRAIKKESKVMKAAKQRGISNVKLSKSLVRKIRTKSMKISTSSTRTSRYLHRESLLHVDSVINEVAKNASVGRASRAGVAKRTAKDLGNRGEERAVKRSRREVEGDRSRRRAEGRDKSLRRQNSSIRVKTSKSKIVSNVNAAEIVEKKLKNLSSKRSNDESTSFSAIKHIRKYRYIMSKRTPATVQGDILNMSEERTRNVDHSPDRRVIDVVGTDSSPDCKISRNPIQENVSVSVLDSSTDVEVSPSDTKGIITRNRHTRRGSNHQTPERVSVRPIRQVRKNIRYRWSDDESDFVDLDMVDLDDLDMIVVEQCSTSKAVVSPGRIRETSDRGAAKDSRNVPVKFESISRKSDPSTPLKKVLTVPALYGRQIPKSLVKSAKNSLMTATSDSKSLKSSNSESKFAMSDCKQVLESLFTESPVKDPKQSSNNSICDSTQVLKSPDSKFNTKIIADRSMTFSTGLDSKDLLRGQNFESRLPPQSGHATKSVLSRHGGIEADGAKCSRTRTKSPVETSTPENVKELRQNKKPISFYSENLQAPLIISPKKKAPKFSTSGTPERSRSTFPAPQDGGQLIDVPVYQPTPEQFHDPLEYIMSIRQTAEPFGMCRIIPPDSWKPESRVSEELRFTSQLQYIHKMHKRWGSNAQKMECIRKHLTSVNVDMELPPMIGGVEVDLPKLYQTIQSFGGLKNVTEKKTIIKVADAMKIPKSALERGTKLYDIYCKYLLSYDTLSEEDKQRLEHQVLSDRLRKNKNQEEDEDCIIKGRSMNINTFSRLARNTQSMWFKEGVEPTPEQVENEYWQLVNERTNHTMVQCGHVDTAAHGSAFPSRKDSPFSRHGWNFNILCQNPMSILRCLGPVSGVTVPTLHLGMLFTTSCWSTDHHFIPYIQYLHTGADLIWYSVPASEEEKLQTIMRDVVPDLVYEGDSWLPEDTVMISPELLRERGISLCRSVQSQGQFTVVFTKCYTATISCGHNVAESVHFAFPDWISYAVEASEMLYKCCESQLFSIHRLLCTLARHHGNDPALLKVILPHLKHYIYEELSLRHQVAAYGLKASPDPFPRDEPLPGSKKTRAPDVGSKDNLFCDISKAICYLSVVMSEAEGGVYSVEQALVCRRRHLKSYKLLVRYSQSELLGLVKSVQEAISNLSTTSSTTNTPTRRQLRK